MAKDYLAMIKPKPDDRLDVGVKGMKWGVRRSPLELQNAAKQASADKAAGKTEPPGAESSVERYARLKAQAKTGQGSAMSDTDLKFFNARTEALSKVAKMNETKEGWLGKTAKNVLLNTAQKQMQAISDEIANKYIKNPIAAALADNSAAIKAESKTAIDYVGKHRAKK